VAFSPDGQTVATAAEHGGCWLWDVATGKQIGEPLIDREKTPGTHHVSFVDDGKSLITMNTDGPTQRWDLASRTAVARLESNGPRRHCQAVSPDGRYFALAQRHWPWVELYDAMSLKPLAVLKGHFGDIQDLSFFPDSTILASASTDGEVRLWDVARYAAAEQEKSNSAPAAEK
jgi:WD40 repeat protein